MTSERADNNTPEYIIVGRITKPHGIRGAVRIEPLTEDPGRFKNLDKIYIGNEDQPLESFDISNVQIANKFVILTFQQITDRNAAELLRQKYLFVHKDELITLQDDQLFLFEIVGMTMQTENGDFVGIVQELAEYPAHDVFVVKDDDKEYLIPDVPEIVIDVNADTNTITIRPIEGLLE